jgi:hypothetical protein
VRVSAKQMEAVLALPGSRRFEHFVKVVADWQQAWGLYQDGWALAAADDGVPVLSAVAGQGICADVRLWQMCRARADRNPTRRSHG